MRIERLANRWIGHVDQDVRELREFWGARLDADPRAIS